MRTGKSISRQFTASFPAVIITGHAFGINYYYVVSRRIARGYVSPPENNRQKAYEGDAKGDEFSRLSKKEHWRSGYFDTRHILQHQDWLVMSEIGDGITTHDVHRENGD